MLEQFLKMETKKLSEQDTETLKKLAKECQFHIDRLIELKKEIVLNIVIRRKQKNETHK